MGKLSQALKQLDTIMSQKEDQEKSFVHDREKPDTNSPTERNNTEQKKKIIMKFRAWDEENKRFVPDKYYDQLLIRLDGSLWWWSHSGFKDVSDVFDIQLYSNSVDKNKKLICEGDNIRVNNKEIGEIIFDENGFQAYLGGIYICPLTKSKYFDSIEIVGNNKEGNYNL